VTDTDNNNTTDTLFTWAIFWGPKNINNKWGNTTHTGKME